jgi:hypothetical protein
VGGLKFEVIVLISVTRFGFVVIVVASVLVDVTVTVLLNKWLVTEVMKAVVVLIVILGIVLVMVFSTTTSGMTCTLYTTSTYTNSRIRIG